MSYTSHSVLAPSARLPAVRELVYALNYKRHKLTKELPTQTDNCFWYDNHEDRSWVGVELQVYRTKEEGITVDTRSRLGRSYWDLTHQNRTIKLLRDCFGGSFTTDGGENRYWRPEDKPPTPISSSCYKARWKLKNAMGSARVYLMNRNVPPLNEALIKLAPYSASITPVLISNNLLLPYLIAVWEEYFRAMFTAALSYSAEPQAVLKRARLTSSQLEDLLVQNNSVARALAETFSFQRPSAIAEHFRLIDRKLDLGAALRRPYRRRRTSLFDLLEELVERRNEFVHSGAIRPDMTDRVLKGYLQDFEVAADRAYDALGHHYGFVPIRDY